MTSCSEEPRRFEDKQAVSFDNLMLLLSTNRTVQRQKPVQQEDPVDAAIAQLAHRLKERKQPINGPAHKLDRLLSHQTKALLNGLSSLVQVVSAAASQLRLSTQTSGLIIRRQQQDWDEINSRYGILTQYRQLKHLREKANPTPKPPPEGMFI